MKCFINPFLFSQVYDEDALKAANCCLIWVNLTKNNYVIKLRFTSLTKYPIILIKLKVNYW